MNENLAGRIRVAVLGAGGRMGRTVCDAIDAAADLELVASVEAGEDLAAALAATRADVAVDFTVPGVTEANVHTAIDEGVHVVVGTTGWTDESRARVAEHLARRESDGQEPVGVAIVPNFSLSAVLLMAFAAQAAPYFESIEVIELHHPDKVDAPSGTARHTAARIAAARAGLPPFPDATEGASAARGLDVDGVQVHAVRLRGAVAHEEVLLGNPGELLTIRQDSLDRSSFMPGVLMAVRAVRSRPGLTVGLEHFMNLA